MLSRVSAIVVIILFFTIWVLLFSFGMCTQFLFSSETELGSKPYPIIVVLMCRCAAGWPKLRPVQFEELLKRFFTISKLEDNVTW